MVSTILWRMDKVGLLEKMGNGRGTYWSMKPIEYSGQNPEKENGTAETVPEIGTGEVVTSPVPETNPNPKGSQD